MPQCKVTHNGTAYRFQDTESAQAFIDQLPTPRGHIEIEGGTTLFRLLNDVGAPILNWKEINAEICNEWDETFGDKSESNWPLLSVKRVDLLALFKSVMDIAERSVSAEDAELIRNAREQQYKTFIFQESMVGENICVETLYAVTEREIKAGRMRADNSIRLIATDGIAAPHLTRAELLAQIQPKQATNYEQKIGLFSSKNLTWDGFLLGIATLFGLLFFLNYNLYAMPDAVSVTVGSLFGYFFGTWIVWIITKFKMKDRKPEFKFFFLTTASLITLIASFSGILKLLA